MNDALLIFIKNPQLGKVKTRLAATEGDERALHIYRELLRHTREVTRQAAATRYLYYSQHIDEQDDWQASDFTKRVQAPGDLGHRMASAFEEVLAQHDRAVIVGSDCAQLRIEHVQQAFEALDSYDVVLGPADDGGYYLLGMKTLHRELFEGIDWSTDAVADQTRRAVANKSLILTELPTLSDIDYIEDWEKHGWEL